MRARNGGGTTGAERLVSSLERLGVEYVFGMPGTQNVALFEALRGSRLRTVVATNELAASFMANGYARTTGRPGILLTIPGPGFTWALTGLAEARLGSAPMIHIVGAPATAPGRRFQLQAIDQAAMAAPVSKAVISVGSADEIPAAVADAYALALAGEPGPVVVEVSTAAMDERGAEPATASLHPQPAPVACRASLAEVLAKLVASRRVLIYAGQGAVGDPEALARLAVTLGAVVATTTSARGVMPEDHPLVVSTDCNTGCLEWFLERADVVLALGVKFSHNGAHGFRLQLEPERLIHVDASVDSLEGHYPAAISVAGDVPDAMRRLETMLSPLARSGGWEPAERVQSLYPADVGPEPAIPHAAPPSPAGFFAMLRRALPPDAILATDSGMHQMLARRYFPVLARGGLLVPTGFQSMGFGLPAAIGAKLAEPTRTVVALIGDGGLLMAGMEILTAVREGIPLLVIVFVDGHYGLIRQQQIGRHGRAHGTEIRNPDLAQWSASLGVDYLCFDGDESLRAAVATSRPALLEVRLCDSTAMQVQRLKSLTRETVLDMGGADVRKWWSGRKA